MSVALAPAPAMPPTGPSRLFTLAIVVVVAIAAAWRLIGVTEWPLNFYEAVQYESAITARSIWLRIVPRTLTAEEATWVRDGHMRVTSPPILQSLAAMTYVVLGGEEPWVVGVWNALFWAAAGRFVFKASAALANDRLAGLITLSWCLLAPGGIVLTRSFQPESLLSLGMAASVFILTRPQAGSAWRDTRVCIAVCAAAAFIKPGILYFPLFAGFAARVLSRRGSLWNAFGHWVLFVAALAAPGVVYTYLVLGFEVTGRFMPALLGEPNFYRFVAARIGSMVGTVPVLIGVVGALGLAARRSWVSLAMLAGYAAYIPAFTWHTFSHAYYHAHLIPLIAVCLGPPVAAVLRRVKVKPVLGLALGAMMVAICLAITYFPFTGPWRWVPGVRETVAAREEEVRHEAEMGREIGSIVGPGASCICLSNSNGLPLEYHAWIRTEFWPGWAEIDYIRNAARVERFDPVKHLDRLIETSNPRYFIVTDLAEFATHTYLVVLLKRYFPTLVASTDRYRIYSR